MKNGTLIEHLKQGQNALHVLYLFAMAFYSLLMADQIIVESLFFASMKKSAHDVKKKRSNDATWILHFMTSRTISRRFSHSKIPTWVLKLFASIDRNAVRSRFVCAVYASHILCVSYHSLSFRFVSFCTFRSTENSVRQHRHRYHCWTRWTRQNSFVAARFPLLLCVATDSSCVHGAQCCK